MLVFVCLFRCSECGEGQEPNCYLVPECLQDLCGSHLRVRGVGAAGSCGQEKRAVVYLGFEPWRPQRGS